MRFIQNYAFMSRPFHGIYIGVKLFLLEIGYSSFKKYGTRFKNFNNSHVVGFLLQLIQNNFHSWTTDPYHQLKSSHQGDLSHSPIRAFDSIVNIKYFYILNMNFFLST